MYFWGPSLHLEFMRHFIVFGKTWKVISQRMQDNGITDRDQLQCRTHGQKYLLSLEEIRDNINKGKNQAFDKKTFQKIQRFEDDRKYLYNLYLEDQKSDIKQLDF